VRTRSDVRAVHPLSSWRMRRIFGPKREQVTERIRRISSFIFCIPYQALWAQWKREGRELSNLFGLTYTHNIFFMALPAHSGPRPLIQFRNHFSQTVGLLGRVISPSQGRYLNTGQHKHRINAYTYQTYKPRVRFEPTIPASERAKTIHALDRAATVTRTRTV
jgi:hypothetical protein